MATQVLPLQQPPQFDGPQGVMHTPLWHAVVPVQATQTAPLVPHTALLWLATLTQVLPLQQPVAQLAALQLEAWQLPLWQVVVPVHAAHAMPAAPHWAFDSLPTATQVLPLQQPAQLPGPHVAVLVQTPP